MKRVVVDSNVLASALVGKPDAAPALLLEAAREHRVEMIACPKLIDEVRKTLAEPYFRALLSEDEAVRAVRGLREVAAVFADPIEPAAVLRDRDDDFLLALARSRGAEAIVTGDSDLLDHKDLDPPAITPREAVTRLASAPDF